jgi:hypothetical protein
LFWTLVGLALAALFVAAPIRLGDGLTWLSLPPAVAAVATGLVPVMLAWRGRFTAAVGACLIGAVLTYGLAFQTLLPRLDRMWLAQRIAEILPPDTPVAAAGYHEPSLVFLMGTGTRLTDGAGAARFLLSTPDAAAVVEKKDENLFLQTLKDDGREAHRIGEVAGFNYSRGRPADLMLWNLEEKAGLQPPAK